MRRHSRTGDELINEDDEQSAATNDITSIRNMDKLKVFFKYTAVKAELDKAELERDALLDALCETRSTLSDVRSQRDNLDAELKRERQLTALVKQHLGGHPDHVQEKLADLVATRQEWEMRTRSAEEELNVLRRELAEVREREELLERENVMMGAHLAPAEMARDGLAGLERIDTNKWQCDCWTTATDGSLPPSVSQLDAAQQISSTRQRPSCRRFFRFRPLSALELRCQSSTPQILPPRLANPHDEPHDFRQHSPPIRAFALAAVRRISSYIQRVVDSSASEMEPAALGLGDIGSPLMNQTLQSFGGPKSSYGSKMSSDSTQTDEYSEYADQSFDLSTGVKGLARLKRADAAFLSDLTSEIELSPEDARGRKAGE